MSLTLITNGPSSTGPISIKPLINPDSDNMGLQNYNLSLFPGTFQEEQLACLEKKGFTVRLTK